MLVAGNWRLAIGKNLSGKNCLITPCSGMKDKRQKTIKLAASDQSLAANLNPVK